MQEAIPFRTKYPMTLKQPQRTSLVGSTIKSLGTAIGDGQWPVGSRLPTEPELAALLGVGRNTIREAVRALVHNGVLESRQGAGVFVVSTSEVTAVLQRHLSASEPAEVLEVRLVLEVGIAALAAQRRSETDLAAIRAALLKRDEAVRRQSRQDFIDSDLQFHRAVATGSGNSTLKRLYEDFEPFVREDLDRQCEHAPDGQIPAIEHHSLYDAIAGGDPAAASAAARSYLESAGQVHAH